MSLQPGRSAFMAMIFTVVGCKDARNVALAIHDPCGQSVLSFASAIDIEVRAPALASPLRATFAASDHAGEITLPLVSDATVSVAARRGTPASTYAAGSIGLIDLSAGSDISEVSVTVGGIDTFAATTDAQGACVGLSSPRWGHTASPLPDGRVLIVGGQGATLPAPMPYSTSELYDSATGTFVPGPDLGDWKRVGHAATVLRDGRVLLTGGLDESEAPSATWRLGQIYDGASGVATAVAMKATRAFHTATLLVDGRVLVAGGVADGLELDSTEIFDPSTMRFSDGPQLLGPRAHHAAVRVGPAAVALIGGEASGQVLGTVEFVQLSPAGVLAGPTLAVARTDLAAILTDDGSAVIVVGGFAAQVANPATGQGVAALEIIRLGQPDLSSSQLTCPGLALATPRGAPALGAVPGSWLVVGGVVSAGTTANSAEEIRVGDIASCDITMSVIGTNLNSSRAAARITPLLSGDLLVTGGFDVQQGQPRSLSLGEVFTIER